ncbi:DUF2630 family protein [Puerhibacterium sp. TATVAM-FAB25]|jgi:hypothetical protein|uniref:DUF2630 family protein n=1 Tax=Puerhibacterium sp. TATVAM-FAB25 TaxID=3093699 RepID=UPI00397BF20B
MATTDGNIRELINQLVEQEKQLREQLSGKPTGEGRDLLKAIQVELDQCWDLLRRRDAAREFGRNPDDEQVRPADTVENYRN